MSKPSSSIEAKREEFRKYLEKEGILESLTKSLVISNCCCSIFITETVKTPFSFFHGMVRPLTVNPWRNVRVCHKVLMVVPYFVFHKEC